MTRKIINYFYGSEEEHQEHKLEEIIVITAIVLTIANTIIRLIVL